jgi:hypothetical protein
LTYLKKDEKTRKALLDNCTAAINNDEYRDEIAYLLKTNMIKQSLRVKGEYHPTFKGILCFGYSLDNYSADVSKLLDELSDLFYKQPSDMKIAARDKVFLMCFLGVGIITRDYPLKLDKSRYAVWKEAVEATAKFMIDHGLILDQQVMKDLWPTVKGENEVVARMVRLRELPLITENIFVTDKKDGLYLDLIKNNVLEDASASFIISIIFSDKKIMNFEEKETVIKFLDDLSKYTVKLYDITTPYDSFDMRLKIANIIRTL